MTCMATLLRDHKAEIEDILAGDKQLARELVFDMKQVRCKVGRRVGTRLHWEQAWRRNCSRSVLNCGCSGAFCALRSCMLATSIKSKIQTSSESPIALLVHPPPGGAGGQGPGPPPSRRRRGRRRSTRRGHLGLAAAAARAGSSSSRWSFYECCPPSSSSKSPSCYHHSDGSSCLATQYPQRRRRCCRYPSSNSSCPFSRLR